MTPIHHSVMHFETRWLGEIIEYRTEELDNWHEAMGTPPVTIMDIAPPPELPAGSHYRTFIDKHQFGTPERLLLALAMARSTFSCMFNPLVKAHQEVDKRSKIGGVMASKSKRFMPTLQTLFFLLAGANPEAQYAYYLQFREKHPLFLENILQLATTEDAEDWAHRPLNIAPAYLDYFLGDKVPSIADEPDFPATLLNTNASFGDLVASNKVMKLLEGPINYANNFEKLQENPDARKKIKPGYVMLLHGEPGTGKTFTAKVLGNYLGIDTYYLNLSQVIDKYIGETEKNLEKVFNRLENKKCILFIDEADALFGKRSEVKEAKDRFANQEVAYLLQRIENFAGVVMLATNYVQNLDKAFRRRILNYVELPLPQPKERRKLWHQSIPNGFTFEYPELPEQLAQKFALTGGNIANIIKQACLKATAQDTTTLLYNEHLEGFIREEFVKDERAYTPVVLSRPVAEETYDDAPEDEGNNENEAPETGTNNATENQEATQADVWREIAQNNKGWDFAPSYLPDCLAQHLDFTREQINEVLKNAWKWHHQQRNKTFNFSTMTLALRKAYSHYRNEDDPTWETMKKQLIQALESWHTPSENLPAETSKTEQKNEAKTSKTFTKAQKQAILNNSPLVNSQRRKRRTKPAKPKNPNRLLIGEEAAECWRKYLPEGFSFDISGVPSNLGKFTALKESDIKKVLEQACAKAQEQGTTIVRYSAHINPFVKEAYENDGRIFKLIDNYPNKRSS